MNPRQVGEDDEDSDQTSALLGADGTMDYLVAGSQVGSSL
jgi:hypothetical protein